MRATLYTILHFFIRENIIVASAVTALALSTFYIFHQPIAYPYLLSLWAGAILSYSFAKEGIFKYRDPLWWSCVLIVGYCFFLLNLQGRMLLFLSGVLSILYNAPFLSQNLRSIPFLKIAIVAFCWVLSAVFLPLSESTISFFSWQVWLLSLQYFLWICVLILPFDIRDRTEDRAYLHTFPTVLGVRKTKIIGIITMLCYLLLSFYHTSLPLRLIQIGIACITLLFLLFAREEQSPFYSGLLVECIPILYFLLLWQYYP